MKILIYLFTFIFASCTILFAEEEPIGRMIQVKGDVDLTDVSTEEIIVPGVGTQIYPYHKIRTGNRAYIEIILNEGTKIFIHEGSVLRIMGLKLEKGDAPTRIKMLTGRIRVNVNRPSDGRTLIVETPTAIAGVGTRASDLGVIATMYEARVAVFSGKVDVANSNRAVIKSYGLVKKEESVIRINMPPTEPVTLPPEIFENWIDYYDIASGDRIVVKGSKKDGVIGYFLRKRKY